MAATIKKIHAPNQLAAVFEVSGSPLENLLYTFTPPIKPQTAPIAYTNFVPGSKYPVIRFVASVMPACPLPCAWALTAAARIAADKKIFFLIVICF